MSGRCFQALFCMRKKPSVCESHIIIRLHKLVAWANKLHVDIFWGVLPPQPPPCSGLQHHVEHLNVLLYQGAGYADQSSFSVLRVCEQ